MNTDDSTWGLLGQTWDHFQIPPNLAQDIEVETTKFLAREVEGLTCSLK